MPKLDPPFPSFTLMMNEYNNDSLRLPSYRESLVVRFHPYPRKQTKSAALMSKQKVDYRYEEAAPAQDEEIIPPTPPVAVDDVAVNLDRALSREEEVGIKRRRSLTSLIIDLALAVRNRYRIPRIGKRESSVSKDD